MMTDIHAIKDRLKLEDLIAETYTITGKGRQLTTQEHDSLKIRTDWQRWYWYSRGTSGDIVDWYMQQHTCDFRQALEDLARRAGLELEPLSPERQATLDDKRQRDLILRTAADYYHQQLLSRPEALAYCQDERGWTLETIKRERIGYVDHPFPSGEVGRGPTDNKDLSVELRNAGLLSHPMAKAVLSIPTGMIVYVHQERGRPIYLSGRSIEGKRHYNLPADLAGEKPVYTNDVDKRTCDAHLLVEGQADAIALGQLGIPATALCGADGVPVKATHIALDNDKAGVAKALDLALAVDPLARIVTWPKTLRHAQEHQGHITVKDANDLLKGRLEEGALNTLLEEAPMAIQQLATVAGKAKNDERKELIARFFSIYSTLDEMVAADLKPDLANRLCGGLAQFTRLMKAHEKANEDEKPSPERYEHSAGGAIGGIVWEQCITWDALGGGTAIYVVRHPNGKIEYQKMVDVGNITFVPYPATLGVIRSRRIVLFPERAEEYGSEKELVKEVQDFLHEYFDFRNPFYEKLAAYYVLFSWLYDIFENLPYLRALGDYGTGKTRFIQAIGVLCYRPMLVSGASTASPVFRLIDMFRGTLIMDEADFSNSDADNEIIKIINVGYYKGGSVMRAEKEANADIYSPETYDVFGPKILATRKPFTDRAVESRCLTHRTNTARPRPGIPYMLNESFWSRSQTLRNKLLMYRIRNHRSIIVDEKLANESVEPRLNQVTMALKSIIGDIEMRQEIDTFIAAYNETLISDRQMTIPSIVTQALVEIYYNPKTDMLGNDMRDFTMKGIADKSKELMSDIDPDAKIYSQIVSKVLNEELGMVKRAKHPEHRRVMVVFDESELKALMKRYGIEDPMQQI